MSVAGCPCCVSASLLVGCGALFLGIHIFRSIIISCFPKSSVAARAFSLAANAGNVLVLIVAICLGILNTSDSLRSKVFYHFAMKLLASDHPTLDKIRCDHLSTVRGRVLEIGPGPATNFRCWSNNNNITEWVGVEPNTFFESTLQQEKLKRNISFPISTIWLNSEANLDIEPGSFDYVVGTHVLCSVTNIFDVLKQVRRALKPSGHYLFLEHVMADWDAEPWTYVGQMLIQPFVNIIGNGCLFKDTWNYLSDSSGLTGFEVDLQHRRIDMPLGVFSPHIFGDATKK